MAPEAVRRAAERYLSLADGLLPGLVTGFYLVGSSALGAYREGRSDVDFVAVVEGELGRGGLRRLRALHALSGLRTGTGAARHRKSPLTGTCNGVFVRRADLTRPVGEITPIASHCGHAFAVGRRGSDVSPVAWKVLAERGIAVRGADAASLGLDPEPERLRSWNLGNLESYWRPWAGAVLRPPRTLFRLRPRWSTAWGALGAPRLHHTIATGSVISKEHAGEYALDVFPPPWHALIADALAYWRMDRRAPLPLSPAGRAVLTAEFVLHVIDSAGQLEAA